MEQSVSCEAVFSSAGQGASFRRPVNIFAPAFIVSGNRITTPQASCRIKSARSAGDRRMLVLACANSISYGNVTAILAQGPDGSLTRYLNDQDSVGSNYRKCSR